jgi:hypothetical protein
MQAELKRRTTDRTGGIRSRAPDETRELALLGEFLRHQSVASLASDIAERLGADVRGEDLIAAAGLGGNRRDSRRDDDPSGAMAD